MKRVICFLVIIAVIVTSCAAVYAATTTSKISANLERKISESQENEKIEIVVWLNTKQYSDDEIDKMVRAELGMQWFFENWGANPSLEAVHEYSAVYNRIASELETAANEEFIQKSGIPEEDVIFVSTKAPMVQLKADTQTIYRLAEMAEVQSMTYEGYTQSQNPTETPTSLNFDKPTEAPAATVSATEEPQSINVREKLDKYVAAYYANLYYTPQIEIRNYEELYEHTNADNETDWVMLFALIDMPAPWCGMGFAGNRVLISGTYDIFEFGMGLYDAQEDTFYDLTKMTDYSKYDGLAKAIDTYGKGALLGDLDGDDALTIIDVTILQRCIAHMSEYPETDTITSSTPIDSSFHPLTYYSDFNRDGERDILDATAIQRYLVG